MMREAGNSIEGMDITSVGYHKSEYLAPPINSKEGHAHLSDMDLLALSEAMGIKKAGVFEKSDVYINGVGFSLKSISAAPPALVNHTTRPGFEMACKKSGVSIKDLDPIIDKYWELRMEGLIKEDVYNQHPHSPGHQEGLQSHSAFQCYLIEQLHSPLDTQ